jgi:hypothetical protein
MSIFIPVHARCGTCGTDVQTNLAASVNADRRPDLRQAILDRTFQAMICPNCGTQVRLPAHLTYIDMARHQWILVEDIGRIEQWRDVETEADELYGKTFGDAAPPIQRAIGDDMVPRLVFGWPALREKLLADEARIDDTILELLKISILRNVPGPPLNDGTELRLFEADEARLRLRWINATTEEGIADLPVARDLYDALAADLIPWAALKGDLEAGLFVDMKRILLA